MYFLSPSCILIAPDLITIPLRVRRIPRCCTRTRPMLGKVSNYINQKKQNTHTVSTFDVPQVESWQASGGALTRAFKGRATDVNANVNEFFLNHFRFSRHISQYDFLPLITQNENPSQAYSLSLLFSSSNLKNKKGKKKRKEERDGHGPRERHRGTVGGRWWVGQRGDGQCEDRTPSTLRSYRRESFAVNKENGMKEAWGIGRGLTNST